MIFYHGSPIGGLTELTPFLSEHDNPYVYFATNPIVALLYAAKPVPKPFSFYPFGFDTNGNVIYSEYFENAFYHLYKGKTCYLYECFDVKDLTQPTHINCAYTCANAVTVDSVTKIPDLYLYYKQQEAKGLFRVKPIKEISSQELHLAYAALSEYIKKYRLKSTPQHPMSVFIKTHFPNVWQQEES